MIRFAHPVWLNVLWIIPLLLAGIWLEHKWRIKAMNRWANMALWDTALPTRSPGRIVFKRILWVIATGLVILTLAGPQVGTRLTNITREGTDIVIAIDLSQSMQAEDLIPSRLNKAKFEIGRLLSRLRGDRIALVPFAGVAFVQVPLTLDYSALVTTLNALEPGIIPQPGTAIADAIKQAQKAFRGESKAQRILLLITDGEDHETGAIEAAKEANKDGIVIFAIGMASTAGAPIPIKDTRGRITGYKQDSRSGTVVSRLNEELLINIASASNGEYYRATPAGDEFRRIHEKILGMDKEKFEQKQFTDFEDRFQWPLIAAFIIILTEELIPFYRRRNH